MNSDTQKIPEFKPVIPLHLRRHYEGLSAPEKWQWDSDSVQQQQNDWLVNHAHTADQYRRQIEVRLSNVEQDVKPLVGMHKMMKQVKLRVSVIITLIIVPIFLAIFGAWISTRFGKP